MSLVKRKIFWFLFLIVILGVALYECKFGRNYPKDISLNYPKDYFGVTYSKKFASELGLDWKDAYLKTLDELKVKYVRLPIYWDEIETIEGNYNFSDYDYLISEGEKRHVNFIINAGWRLPRWPECHAPVWTKQLNTEATREKSLKMIETVVRRYQGRDSVIYWQIENEPLLDVFGECPDSDVNFLRKEVALVKGLDDRRVLVTASGELSSWATESKIGDSIGTTMYRIVWNPWFGYFKYFIPSWVYRFKADFLKIPDDRRIIAELQAEPWVPGQQTMTEMTKEEFSRSLSLEQFKGNVQYAINVRFKQAYLWGVEWWYFQKQKGNPEYWDFAKTLFK